MALAKFFRGFERFRVADVLALVLRPLAAVPTGHIPRAKAQGRVKVHAVASASVVGTDVTLNMFMLVPS